jgi:hypothetical protein
MKHIFAIVIVLFYSAAGIPETSHAANPKAVIEWISTSIDFGEIPFDKPVAVEFSFKNPGMIPLLISDVKPSCGCTVADFPRQPITSGSVGIIKVTFDAKTEGYFSKTITVYSNTSEGMTELFIKGIVVK